MTRFLRPLYDPRTWRSFAYVALDLPFSIVTFTVMITLLALTAGLLITFPLALVTGWVLAVTAVAFGRVERSRIAALLALPLPSPHAPLTSGSWFRRLMERARSASRWREIAFLTLRFPLSVFSFVAVVTVWAGSLALSALPFYVSALPGRSAEFGIFDISQGAGAFAMCALGLAGVLVIAPWTTMAFGAIDRALAGWLMGPGRKERLAQQLTRAEAGRAAAVDSAEAERRRIERDLHDGAQQRLVKLGMDLGMANERFDADPEGARQLVADAHVEAKAALAELRDLVRGFHPAILEDRGLDAALSSVIARSPVPVTLKVDVPARPSSSVESAAYFVVVEALTNVAKHADATSVKVSIERRGDRLAIDVTDNGHGGAAVNGAGGLHGLEERVHALGGWMQVLSPVGGPTTVIVELPCTS